MSASSFHWMDEVEESRQRLSEMPGRKVLVNLRVLARPTRIFVGNSEALLAHLNSDAPALLEGDGFNKFAQYVAEAERLLFNYAAAAFARVEHVRIMTRRLWPQSTPSHVAYQTRVDSEFALSPLHKWIIELRNYMTHHGLPAITGRISAATDGMTASISLQTDELMKSHTWGPVERQFIEEHAPAINVAEAVAEYSEKVAKFDEWIAAEYRQAHLAEIGAYEAAKLSNEETFRRLTKE